MFFKTVNLLDDEPDMIMIKEETFEDSSSKKKTEEAKNNHLRSKSDLENMLFINLCYKNDLPSYMCAFWNCRT